LKKNGQYADRHNLYIQIRNDGARKSWIYRYWSGDKYKIIGLGSFSILSLSDARVMAHDLSMQRVKGVDPYQLRREQKAKPVEVLTFKDAAEQFIEERRHNWSVGHYDQWAQTLRDFASPVIGKLNVAEVGTQEVCKILDPIWKTRPKSADRIRSRIEQVLNFAEVGGHRQGDNPASWKRLKYRYPDPGKSQKSLNEVNGKSDHLVALPYSDLPALMRELRGIDSFASRALQFALLNASRISEVLGMTWEEIDLGQRLWTVPPARMKNKRVHRIGLSHPSRDILFRQKAVCSSKLVFPGDNADGQLCKSTILKLMRRLRGKGVTVHGSCRASFKSWALDHTEFEQQVVEACLSHYPSDNGTEGSYIRTDLFHKRSAALEAWSKYLST
jgi:integrase